MRSNVIYVNNRLAVLIMLMLWHPAVHLLGDSSTTTGIRRICINSLEKL